MESAKRRELWMRVNVRVLTVLGGAWKRWPTPIDQARVAICVIRTQILNRVVVVGRENDFAHGMPASALTHVRGRVRHDPELGNRGDKQPDEEATKCDHSVNVTRVGYQNLAPH